MVTNSWWEGTLPALVARRHAEGAKSRACPGRSASGLAPARARELSGPACKLRALPVPEGKRGAGAVGPGLRLAPAQIPATAPPDPGRRGVPVLFLDPRRSRRYGGLPD